MTGLNIGGFAVGEVMEWKGVYRDPLEMYPDATKPEVDWHRSWLEPHTALILPPVMSSWRSAVT